MLTALEPQTEHWLEEGSCDETAQGELDLVGTALSLSHSHALASPMHPLPLSHSGGLTRMHSHLSKVTMRYVRPPALGPGSPGSHHGVQD